MAAQANAADVKAQLAETLGRCRARLSQTEKTLERLEDEVPPDGCILPVVHTPDCMFDSIARLARLDANTTFLDLGCGDGRVVDGVCKIAGCRGIGVDIRMECVTAARERFPERAFHEGDFCAMVEGAGPPPTGLEGVDACYAHLLPTTFAVLDARLLAAVQAKRASAGTVDAVGEGVSLAVGDTIIADTGLLETCVDPAPNGGSGGAARSVGAASSVTDASAATGGSVAGSAAVVTAAGSSATVSSSSCAAAVASRAAAAASAATAAAATASAVTAVTADGGMASGPPAALLVVPPPINNKLLRFCSSLIKG